MVAMGQAYVLRCATAHAGFDGCDCGHRLRTGKPAGCGSRRLTGSLRCSVSEGSKRRAATVDRGHTHPRRELRSIGGTLSAAWSADGSALSVVDHWASDSARAYIHDAGTLRRLDLGSRILSVDPDAKRFAPRARLFRRGPMGRPTSYIHFQGHTDEAPVVCFDFAIG